MRLFFEGLHFNLFSFDLCERISMIQGVTGKSAFILAGNRTPQLHSPAEKAEHHYYLKIYRCGMWLLFFNQSLETF
jgi:hypothetical protein